MNRNANSPITRFDSSWCMLKALSNYLKDKDNPGVGILPWISTTKLANFCTSLLRERTITMYYSYLGATEAISPCQINNFSTEGVSRLMIDQYPTKSYPAVMIGSSNGAAIHLCAALGIPWIPQTFLIALRHPKLCVDNPVEYMEWAKEPAQALLAANSDISVYQMHDPAQDRLMSQHMAYFRVKRIRLGEVLKEFLKKILSPKAVIFLLECQLNWPTKRVAERLTFQTGGLGGVTPAEYIHGSERVEDFLGEERSQYKRWNSPAPDCMSPEAEWGFDPSLGEDVERFALQNGYRLKRIIFEQVEDFSPMVADLFRHWYSIRGIDSQRLLVDSFNILDPWWTIRTGSVPLWLVFNMHPSDRVLECYLEQSKPYDYINIIVVSHGVAGPGLVPIERWRSLLNRARIRGEFIGVKEERYPKDMGVFLRYNRELRNINARYPMPEYPLTLDQLEDYIGKISGCFQVQFI